jgi:hypothetical protein
LIDADRCTRSTKIFNFEIFGNPRLSIWKCKLSARINNHSASLFCIRSGTLQGYISTVAAPRSCAGFRDVNTEATGKTFMANLTSTLTVRLIDAVTRPARAAANSIRGIGTAAQSTNMRHVAIAGSLQAAHKDLGKSLSGLAAGARRVTSAVAVPAGFLAFFGARSIYDMARLQNTMQAVTGMTAEQADNAKKLAMALSAKGTFGTTELLSAMVELGKAGFGAEKIMGSIGGISDLAAAGGLDLAGASEIAVNAMTALRLPMETLEQAQRSVARIGDTLSYAANASTVDVQDLGESLKYAAPIASALGISLEQLAGTFIILGNKGIKGAEAGVAMRSAMVRLLRPTKETMATLARLGINLDDFVQKGRQVAASDIVNQLSAAGINAKPFSAAIDAALNDPALKGNAAGLTQRLTEIIGGDGSLIDSTVLAEQITDALTVAGARVDMIGFFRELQRKAATVNDTVRIFDQKQGSRLQGIIDSDLLGTIADVEANAAGSAAKTRDVMMQGIVGQWASFKASIERLLAAIADSGVLKSAGNMIDAMASGLRWMADLSPALLEFGTYAALATFAMAPLGIALGGVIGLFKTLKSILFFIGKSGRHAIALFRAAAGVGAAAAAKGVGVAAGGAGAAALAGGKGMGLFGKLWRGAGAVGAGLLVNDVLDAVDPEGNLWGLTTPIDRLAEKYLGFNPSKIPLPDLSNAPLAGAGMAGTAKWQAQQAEIDARLAQIERNSAWQNMGPSKAAHDDLVQKRAGLTGQIMGEAAGAEEAAGSGAAVADAFLSGFQARAPAVTAALHRQVVAWVNMLNFTAYPNLVPRIDGSRLRAVNADIGIE